MTLIQTVHVEVRLLPYTKASSFNIPFYMLKLVMSTSTWSYIPILPTVNIGFSRCTLKDNRKPFLIDKFVNSLLQAWNTGQSLKPRQGCKSSLLGEFDVDLCQTHIL